LKKEILESKIGLPKKGKKKKGQLKKKKRGEEGAGERRTIPYSKVPLWQKGALGGGGAGGGYMPMGLEDQTGQLKKKLPGGG